MGAAVDQRVDGAFLAADKHRPAIDDEGQHRALLDIVRQYNPMKRLSHSASLIFSAALCRADSYAAIDAFHSCARWLGNAHSLAQTFERIAKSWSK
ncbi:hypothetical protein Sbs19_00550 [Sphingobium sp. BS19]|nr:hypothetical protein Sbs19_00550 [Sphingobium sp. BS19]